MMIRNHFTRDDFPFGTKIVYEVMDDKFTRGVAVVFRVPAAALSGDVVLGETRVGTAAHPTCICAYYFTEKSPFDPRKLEAQNRNITIIDSPPFGTIVERELFHYWGRGNLQLVWQRLEVSWEQKWGAEYPPQPAPTNIWLQGGTEHIRGQD